MDTEKAILDTELYQERLSFCVQILSFPLVHHDVIIEDNGSMMREGYSILGAGD